MKGALVSRRVALLLVAALVVYGSAIGLLLWLGGNAPGVGIEPDTSEIPDAPARAANLLVAADQVIGMLFTVTVGLLVGVGFVLRDRDFRVGLRNALQIGLLIVLMIGVICAVYFGYIARMHALLAAHKSLVEYDVINNFIGRQALSVVVTGGAALCLFAIYLAEKHFAAVSLPEPTGGRVPKAAPVEIAAPALASAPAAPAPAAPAPRPRAVSQKRGRRSAK